MDGGCCPGCFTGLFGAKTIQNDARQPLVGSSSIGALPKSSWGTLERAVAAEWERVLALPAGTIGLGDNFISLGGESLLALRACAAVQYILAGTAVMESWAEPQFGMLSGAFAVAALYAATSLATYCDHLRTFGHSLQPSDDASGISDKRASSLPSCVAPDQRDVSWPAVREAARSCEPGAASRLAQLLDNLSAEVALDFCGAAQRTASTRQRFSALHAAAQAGSVDCLQLLLERRARPTITEPGATMTPAHYAAMESDSCLQLLLTAKAPLTVRDARGQSLIHAAARAGNAASLKILLGHVKAGGNDRRAFRSGEGSRGFFEWSDRWHRTSVHWAALNGHAEALSVLLDHGASHQPKLISDHQMAKRTHTTQETPLQIAVRVHGDRSSVARILATATAAEKRKEEVSSEIQGPRYLSTLAEPKLEKLSIWELNERLSASSIKRVQCRIFFQSSAPAGSFAGLKASEKICAVVIHENPSELAALVERKANLEGSAPQDDGDAERAVAQWILRAGSWDNAMATWHQFQAGASKAAAEVLATCTSLTFKVTCRRTGSRFSHVSTNKLAVAMAGSLSRSKGWKAQVRRPDLEVRLVLSDSDLLVDIPLLVQSAIRTGGGEVCAAGLSAPVAWALARSAELCAGDRVLDPMCGRAVVLVEAAMSWPACDYIGLDIDRDQQLSGAALNVKMTVGCGGSVAGGASIDLLHGDARHLPLPNGSVDALICDVPFGKMHSTVEECRGGLYDEILSEFDRVVHREKGRMVILSSLDQEPWIFRAAGFDLQQIGFDASRADAPALAIGTGPDASSTKADAPWTCVGRRKTPLGFLDAVILVFHRSTPEADKPTSGSVPSLGPRLWWETSGGRNDWASLKVADRPPMQLARGREV